MFKHMCKSNYQFVCTCVYVCVCVCHKLERRLEGLAAASEPTLTLPFLWPQHLTPAMLLFCFCFFSVDPQACHETERRWCVCVWLAYHPLLPFYCVLKYLHNENEAFPSTHTHTHIDIDIHGCICIHECLSVCATKHIVFGGFACLIYERCSVFLCSLLLLTPSYTYDIIFYTRLPIMTC